MTGMNQPSMVVFDLDDTLYEYEPCEAAGRQALFRFACDNLGLQPPAFEEAYDQARLNVKHRLGATASSHSRLLYCHEALELLGLHSDPNAALVMEQEYWRTYLLEMQLRPGAVELLQSLRYNDVTTAVVTDLTAQIQFRKIDHLGIAKYVDHIVCSEETAGEKISLEPFRLLGSRVAPQALDCVWFVGDKAFDAPVEELRAEGLIKDGHGFLHGLPSGPLTTSWRDIREIEACLDRSIELAA